MMTEKRITANGDNKKIFHVPLADIYENVDIYSLKLEMPGITKENLNIVIDDNELKITAESPVTENGKDLKYAEFTAKNFSRTFRIGNDIDRNKIDAKLENGVLTLVLHKNEEVKPKKITINQIN
jgi:HSP20 family protein